MLSLAGDYSDRSLEICDLRSATISSSQPVPSTQNSKNSREDRQNKGKQLKRVP